MKPLYIFIILALSFAIPGYVFLCMGLKPWTYGMTGIHGTLFAIIALVVAFKNAGWLGEGFISDE